MNTTKPLLLAALCAASLIGCTEREAANGQAQPAATTQSPSPAPPPAAMDMMDEPMMDMDGAGMDMAQEHSATGTVTAIDAGQAKLTVAHGPVASLDWPAMTMSFQMEDPSALDRLEVGDEVRFSFVQRDGNQYAITDVEDQPGDQ